jgi:alpha-tubulin suppressor-like RCC1 family protein
MVMLSISVVTNSLNDEPEISTLTQIDETMKVILPANQLNQPGHQEGSIFTDSTLSSGRGHTCAILDNGSVSCWGSNSAGQLGMMTSAAALSSPIMTSSLGTGRTAVSIASGMYHTCAILDNGAVSCWGWGGDGQIGNGQTTSIPASPTLTSSFGSGRTAIAISAGNYHTCVILDNGAVSCWGYGGSGAIGNGVFSNQLSPTLTNSLGSGRTAVAISSGGFHTCAVLDNASVSCWGWNDEGQLGNGGTTYQSSPTLTSSLGSGRTAVAISAGERHTCVILDNGAVSCWGWNNGGQLGSGGITNKTVPTLTSSLGSGRTAVAISSGGYHTCAVLDNASVSCWGENEGGRLGAGGNGDLLINQSTPILVNGFGIGEKAVAISLGRYHSCAVIENGSLLCWGWNDDGQLGNGDMIHPTPTQTSSLGTGRTAVQISSGNYHTCTLLDNDTVSCWGSNSIGQLGNGGTFDKSTPTLSGSVGTVLTASEVSSGGSHTCAILDNGSISCWGWNDDGQLGNGGTTNLTTPTLTSSLGSGRTAVAISSGESHTCAILDNGEVSCWGSNSNGQLGNGGNTNQTSPTLTNSLGTGRTAVAISSGGWHTCAILDNGAVSCWGRGDFGQIGNGYNFNTTTPTPTNSLGISNGIYNKAIGISSGLWHTCVALDNGESKCWGHGGYGQLGNGATTDSYQPTITLSLGTGRTVENISVGPAHTCALLDDGSVSCWGYGQYGQIGNGATIDTSSPTQVSSFGNNRTAVALSAGEQHTCAILDDGSVSCWGFYYRGALGNGEYGRFKVSPTEASGFGIGRTVALSERDFDNDNVLNIFQAKITSTDSDGDGFNDTVDDFDQNMYRSVDCNSGTYGRYLCVDAPLGKYVPTYSAIYATDSSPGYYVDLTGQSSQTPCAIGTYQAESSQTSCDDADAGHYVSQTGQSGQYVCSAGTFQASTGQSNCINADVGHYVSMSAATVQTPCATGTYQPNLGSTYCNLASAGHYVDQTGQSSQIACAVGTFNQNYGSTSSSDCIGANPGHYVDQIGQSSEIACSPGSYNPNYGSTTSSACLDSDAGYYVSNYGQSSQNICELGTYQPNLGSTYCDLASAGHYVDNYGQSAQTPCSPGTYQSLTGQTSCDDADTGHYVDNYGQSSQTPCPIGTYQSLTGQTSCDDADTGHYIDQTGQSSQTPCPIGTYQSLAGQTSCENAYAGYYVDQVGQSNETPCPIGTYNPNMGATNVSACVDADSGYYIDQTGQSSPTPCPVGTYQSLAGQTSCDDASAGHYVDQVGQSNQTPCSIGTYNPNNGATSSSSCIDADLGYYVSQTGQSNQTICSIGTYQPYSSQPSCNDADAGYYVDQIGQTSQIACPVGTYQSENGQASCNNAELGYYVEQTSQSSQTPCPVGTYQTEMGQTSCDNADPGYYVDSLLGVGQSSQNPCPIGTYNPYIGSTSPSGCFEAGIGYFVNETGQSSQIPCAIGTYQALTGQTNCNYAEIGFYVSQIGSSSQTKCPEGSSTNNNGSIDETECLTDSDLDMLPNVIDDDDDGDGTLDSDDAFPLDPKEDTDTDGDGMGDNLQTKLEAESQTQMLIVGGISLVVIVIAVLFYFKRKRSLDDHAVKETPSNKDFNQFAIPITAQQLTQSVVTEPTVVQQWTDENGNTWRSMDNGITLWWNGTDWQQT